MRNVALEMKGKQIKVLKLLKQKLYGNNFLKTKSNENNKIT